MSRDSVLRQFDGLNVWKRGGQRAPHRPLLVLYALGRWAAGKAGHEGESSDRLMNESGGWAREQGHEEGPDRPRAGAGGERATRANRPTVS